MFSKILEKFTPNTPKSPDQSETSEELDPRVVIHYGIPSTASRLAYDPIQHILAVGTLDGRIKVIANDNIEGLLTSPNSLPFKYMEFLQNQGFLVSISNENAVLVWDLEHRCVTSSLQLDYNITAFSVINGTNYMYIGDESGSVSVLKYNMEEKSLLQLPYQISSQSVSESLGLESLSKNSVVGVLSQPCSDGFRVVLAYDNGVIVLWDVSEDKMVLPRGYKDLRLKAKVQDDSADGTGLDQSNETLDDGQAGKEITSLCWASLDGSLLAVGYADGDIMLWDLRDKSSTKDHKNKKRVNNVFKLQFSSAKKRLPVIVLNWCPGTSRKNGGNGGRLFAYGGEEIGSAEALTIIDSCALTLRQILNFRCAVKCLGVEPILSQFCILTLEQCTAPSRFYDFTTCSASFILVLNPEILSIEWASGREALKSVDRANLVLHGSFSDMILLQNADPKDSSEMSSLFLLASSGQLQFYDGSCLSAMLAHQEHASPSPVQYSCMVPMSEARLTVGRLFLLPTNADYTKSLMEMASSWRSQDAHLQSNRTDKWPLHGGVPCQIPASGEVVIERLYIAGYQDGSMRIWDATYPVFSPLFVSKPEVNGGSIPGSTAPVSCLDFSSSTLNVAIGCESGLVRLYSLRSSCNETVSLVTEKGSEDVPGQGSGPCSAIFSLCSSPVVTLRYADLGDRLAVGYKSGQVAMLDISSLSVLFLAEVQQSVTSLAMGTLMSSHHTTVNEAQSESANPSESAKNLLFVLSDDSHFSILDSTNGSIVSSYSVCHGKDSSAVSVHILDDGKSSAAATVGENLQPSSQEIEANSESAQESDPSKSTSAEPSLEPSGDDAVAEKKPGDTQILFCLTNELHLYSLQSLFQDDRKPICMLHLQKSICWASTCFKDGKECRVILLYQTGDFEIRSLPDLKVIGEISLLSIMRWSFTEDMEKTMSSTPNGQIALVNGCEFAVVSLFSFENDFRIPHSLPCLHDKTLAAAYSDHFASNKKKSKEVIPTIIVGLVKGLKLNKDSSVDPAEAQKVDSASLEKIFSKLFPEPTVELRLGGLRIDEPLRVEPLHHQGKTKKTDEKKARAKLFEGGTSDAKPKQRSVDEIKAKYGRSGLGDAASAAMEAKNKLLERQEKLDKLAKNTEELQAGAENFASLAHEIAKKHEKRKWWQL